MSKTYKLFLLTLLIPILFAGCKTENWMDDMWKNNKLWFLGGIFVVLIIVILLIKVLTKTKNNQKIPSDSESSENEEQELKVESNLNTSESNYNTELLNMEEINLDPSEETVETVNIIVFVKDEKLGTFKISEKGIIIGRDPSQSGIVVSEPIVSKAHLKIIPEGEVFVIEDLNSTNGTYVDGDKISKTIVTKEKEVMIGKKGNIVIKFK